MQTVKSIWDFFQTELLGMSWLNRLIGDLLNACGLDTAGKVGGSVQFFIYDTIKIMVLLGVLILIISYIQSYFPPERTKKILGRFHGVGANCIAALLGTVTPFCSCSSIPLFIGFTSAGLPLGVTFSFLISSPMVDFGSLVPVSYTHLFERFEAQPNDPEALHFLMREEKRSYDRLKPGDFKEHITVLHDSRIEAEAQRILAEMKRQDSPNSPNKTHFMVELSPYFMQLASTKDTDRLFAMPVSYTHLRLSERNLLPCAPYSPRRRSGKREDLRR